MSGPVERTHRCGFCGELFYVLSCSLPEYGEVCSRCFGEVSEARMEASLPRCQWCNGLLRYDGKTGGWECPNGCHDVTPEDKVLSPSHYTAGGIETIDYLRAKLTPDEFRGYLKGSIIKYLSRANLKGAEQQDYAKASFYATMLTGEDPREVS